LILTGDATGAPTDVALVQRVRDYFPSATIWIGSGLTPSNVTQYCSIANAGIVGTYFHEESNIDAPLSLSRIRQFMQNISF